jgi:CDP-diacylglycerol--glycerol-3-phosphate 3-phosphatidyltransferase
MANAITVARVIAAMVVIYLIFVGTPVVVEWCAIAIIAVIVADGLDGWVARRRHESGQFGAIFDIVGDRIVENALWIGFAGLRLIPIWVPMLVMARGFLVDGLRSAGYADGLTPFGEHNMMRSKLTTFLTAGRFMRAVFGAAKCLGFVFLAGLQAYELPGGVDTVVGFFYSHVGVRGFGWFLVWAAVALTVIRGVPVVIDAMAYLRDKRLAGQPA